MRVLPLSQGTPQGRPEGGLSHRMGPEREWSWWTGKGDEYCSQGEAGDVVLG